MIIYFFTLGFLLCASAQDLTVASGSGDTPVVEGSGESFIAYSPLAVVVEPPKSASTGQGGQNLGVNQTVDSAATSLTSDTSQPENTSTILSSPAGQQGEVNQTVGSAVQAPQNTQSGSARVESTGTNSLLTINGTQTRQSGEVNQTAGSATPDAEIRSNGSPQGNVSVDSSSLQVTSSSSTLAEAGANVGVNHTQIHSKENSSDVSSPVDAPGQAEITSNVTREDLAEATDKPTPNHMYDDRQEVNGTNSTSPTTKVFRMATVESFNLSRSEILCAATVVINTPLSSVNWIHEEVRLFSEAATRSITNEVPKDWKITYIAPSPYRSLKGLQVSFYFSLCDSLDSRNESCCLVAHSVVDIMRNGRSQLELSVGRNITEIHIGLPEEMMILGGIARPFTWDTYTKLAASAVIVAAFLSVLLGMAIACTRNRRRKEEGFYKGAPYPVDLGRNLASDDECKSSEYIISNREVVSKSNSKPDDEDCTWVVPIGEIEPPQRNDVEDTKL